MQRYRDKKNRFCDKNSIPLPNISEFAMITKNIKNKKEQFTTLFLNFFI